jgi:hypothetical protein
MGRPRKRGSHHYAQNWLAGNRGKKYTHAGSVLGCRQCIQQDMQGE